MILLIGLAIIVAVIYVDQGQRRVPIQYAKRVVGRKMTSGGSTYLPLKVNQAGVIPIIFATSVLYFPALLASVYHAEWFQNFVTNYVQNTRSVVYMALLAMLIIFSRTSTRRSSSTRPGRPTTSARTAGSSRASGPDRPRPTT